MLILANFSAKYMMQPQRWNSVWKSVEKILYGHLPEFIGANIHIKYTYIVAFHEKNCPMNFVDFRRNFCRLKNSRSPKKQKKNFMNIMK